MPNATLKAPPPQEAVINAAEIEITSRRDEFHVKAEQALQFLDSVGNGTEEDPTPAQIKALYRIVYDLVRTALSVEVRVGRDAGAAKVMRDTDLTGGS